MLSTLVRFSIRFYGIVIALDVLILLYGSYRFTTAGLDIFFEFAPKQVIIQTEAPAFMQELKASILRKIPGSVASYPKFTGKQLNA